MRFEKLIYAVLASCFFFQPAIAQGPTPLKIGYVDIDSVAFRSPQWEEGKKNLDKEFNNRNKAIRDKEVAAGQLQEKLLKEGKTMKAEEAMKLEDQLVAQDRDARFQKSILDEDYKRRINRLKTELEQEINKTLFTLVKQEGYDLILTTGVFMPSDRVNLTERVLTELKNSAGKKK